MIKIKEDILYKSEIFSQRLREAREYRGLSQKKIADLLGIQNASYGKYELGERELNASLLPKIANFERIDINFYFDDEKNIKESDLDFKNTDKAIKELTREIQEIKHKINPIATSKTLSSIIDSLGKLNEEALSRFEFIVDAFVLGEQSKNEQLEKKRKSS